MNALSRSACLFAILLSGASALLAGPWEPLFNGKDLSGWKQIQGKAPYSVVDDAIVGVTMAGTPNSFLATERSYGDFILEFEVRQEGATNSGVQFRSLQQMDINKGIVHGYQCEIDPTQRGWTGGIYDEARRGWLYPGSLNPSAKHLYQLGRWNHFRIEAIGSTLRTWVNGLPVSHVIDDLTASGFIALQVHSIGRPEDAGKKVMWRNLRIQTTDLKPSPVDALFVRNLIPNSLSEAEKAQGWRLAWDGRSTAGWRGAHQATFPDFGWKIQNGELAVLESGGGEAKHGGDIVTLDEFSAFEFEADFKLSAGANSGIKYFVTEQSNPGGGSAIGLEMQLLDDEKHPDAKLGAAGNRTLASLYDLIPREKIPAGLGILPKIGVWNHARIVVHPDNRVEHWLNGIKLVEYQRGSPAFMAMVARSKYEKFADFGLAAKGRILLQDHGNEVHFRSIKVRPLSP